MLAPTLSLTALFSIAHFATAAIWQPPLNAKWNIQLKSVPKLAQADNAAHNVRDFDGTDASKETIAHFHVKGKKVICYFSAGSYEDWRPDASSFPKAALGKDLDGWEGEKWLDVRSPAILTIMKARIKALKDKGCDGVDPDNIDGYGNDTGFDLTKQDAIDYLHAMAKYTHSLGMSFGLQERRRYCEENGGRV